MTKLPRIETKKMAARDLRPHPIAQRRIVAAKLAKIIKDLDLDGIGVLHVVRYAVNGVTAWWVLDGQHRHAALLHHGFGEWEVDVQIHHDIKTDAAAARLFRILNDRSPMAPFDAFMIGLTEGLPVAVGANRVVADNGLRVARTSSDGSVSAVAALKAVYAKDDGRALDLTLGTLKEAWGAKAAALEGKLIEGLGLVYATHNGAVDRSALCKKLAKFAGGPSALLGASRNLQEIKKGNLPRSVAEVIIGVYNQGRRVGQLGPV